MANRTRQEARALSAYRIVWIMALFDLPVGTKLERKRATKFREFLLDEGFTMMQFSCYVRFSGGKEYAEAITRRVGKSCPKSGKVDVIWFTDKQYTNIRTYRGTNQDPKPPKPDQLTLF
jgi:CRISPR-associated protein Cas2